jgi:hypothetical protein
MLTIALGFAFGLYFRHQSTGALSFAFFAKDRMVKSYRSLRFARDDKGRTDILRKYRESDGENQERLLPSNCRSLRFASVGMTRGG